MTLDGFFQTLLADYGTLETLNLYSGRRSSVESEIGLIRRNLEQISAVGVETPEQVFSASDPQGRERTFRLLVESTAPFFLEFRESEIGYRLIRLHRGLRLVKQAIEDFEKRQEAA